MSETRVFDLAIPIASSSAFSLYQLNPDTLNHKLQLLLYQRYIHQYGPLHLFSRHQYFLQLLDRQAQQYNVLLCHSN